MCDTFRVHDSLFKWICVYVFVLLTGGVLKEGGGHTAAVTFLSVSLHL